MANRGPRRPKRMPIAGSGARTVIAGAESGLRMVERLERQYQDALRRAAAAPPVGMNREQRARRVTASQDQFRAGPMMPWWLDDDVDPGAAIAPAVAAPAPAPSRPLMPWITETPRVRAPGEEAAPQQEQLLIAPPPAPPAPPDTDWGEWEEPSSTEYYAPTRSSNPPRPRTLQMSYDRRSRIMRVTYRDGGTYDYFQVPGPVWYRIRQVKSPGRFIDRNVKGTFAYERVAL